MSVDTIVIGLKFLIQFLHLRDALKLQIYFKGHKCTCTHGLSNSTEPKQCKLDQLDSVAMESLSSRLRRRPSIPLLAGTPSTHFSAGCTVLSDRIVPLWALVSLASGLSVPSHQGWRPRVQRRAPNRSDSDLGQVGASSGDLYYQMCEDDFE